MQENPINRGYSPESEMFAHAVLRQITNDVDQEYRYKGALIGAICESMNTLNLFACDDPNWADEAGNTPFMQQMNTLLDMNVEQLEVKGEELYARVNEYRNRVVENSKWHSNGH